MSKEVSVRLGKINYVCTVDDGHHQWMLDEPVENGGSDLSPDPYTALLASVGGCTAITMRMYAQRKGWNVEAIEIKMSLVTATEGGERKTVFTRSISVEGNLTSEQLSRLQQIATACPVSKILEGEIAIDTTITHAPDKHSITGNNIQENI